MSIVVSELEAAHVASITKSPLRGVPARFLSPSRESTIQGVVDQRVLGDRCHVQSPVGQVEGHGQSMCKTPCAPYPPFGGPSTLVQALSRVMQSHGALCSPSDFRSEQPHAS